MLELKNKLSLKIKLPFEKENILTNHEELKCSKKDCHHIIDNIYLSGYYIASDYDYLKKNDFTHLINCAFSSRNFNSQKFDQIEYLNLIMNDDPGYLIGENLEIFIEFIEKIKQENKQSKILVHCFEGISRGPTMILAYLIWKLNISREEGYKIIKENRPCIDINLGFLFQLDTWSQKCRNKIDFLNKKNRIKNEKEFFFLRKKLKSVEMLNKRRFSGKIIIKIDSN